MYITVQGAGRPAVLIHGLGASSFSWREFAPALATRYKTYLIDLLGFGQSPAPPVFPYQRVDEPQLQPCGSGLKLTASSAASLSVAVMRITKTAPLAVVRASRYADAPARSSLGVPAPSNRRMIRPRL